MEIIIPILICLGIAAVCAIILTVSNILFGVQEDEKFLAIRDTLPGANCGACGFSGCDGYARALSEGKISETNLCVPGGDTTSQAIARVLGVEAGVTIKQFAYVGCHGTCEATKKDEKHLRDGFKTCREAAEHWEGENVCTYACIGLGDCAAACPNNAIIINDGVATVISTLCSGCGLCAKTCPHNTIRMIEDGTIIAIGCSNHDKGALTRKMCTNGCIGCTKCARTCPNGAITMDNNLPVLDHSKCTSCGMCVDACPVHVIHKDVFVCDKCFL